MLMTAAAALLVRCLLKLMPIPKKLEIYGPTNLSILWQRWSVMLSIRRLRKFWARQGEEAKERKGNCGLVVVLSTRTNFDTK